LGFQNRRDSLAANPKIGRIVAKSLPARRHRVARVVGVESIVAFAASRGMAINIRAIAVANGGGDCPGLNAVLRAVVKTAVRDSGWRVLDITNGFDGLIGDRP